MATHYLNSQTSINSYRDFSLTSQISSLLPPNQTFTVVEENLGINCSFHKINYNNSSSYLERKYVSPLSGTANSAPFVCKIQLENASYVEPSWMFLDESEPYFNDKTKEYCITITSEKSNIGDKTQLFKKAKEKAIKKLFQYYNKGITDDQLFLYNNYYIFAEVKDFYVPFRPLSRTKVLVSIKQKYFDAVPELIVSSEQTQEDNSKADYIISIPMYSFEESLKNISNILNLYNTDVFLSNSKIGIKFGTNGFEPFDTSTTIMEDLSFTEQAERIMLFYETTIKLLAQNEIQFLVDEDKNDKIFLEFAINDKCNIIYDVNINDNSNCIRPKIGIDSYLNKEPINNPTIVNFIKNYKAISKIEKCKVSWVEFAERYIYPSVSVREFSINDVLQGPEKNAFEYVKDLLKIFASINAESANTPAKTLKDLALIEAKAAFFTSVQAFKLSKEGLLPKMLYTGDNSFDPTATERSLAQLYLINDNSKDDLEEKEKKAQEKADQYFLVKLYDILNKTGICRINDFALGCLLNLLNDFVEVDLQATINKGSISSLTSEELLEEVIPYLPKEQQTLVYNELLLGTNTINSTALLYYLKTTLPSEQYQQLGLETATYENIVSVTAELMSTSE